ncbi:MAG TPA: Hsp20/alpha crystallin family protein [Streptosporangiaceae bacterium]|nr:Hsp20/alpha crystallin family protein [Streptosporangiaceae bacterium]
MAMLPARRGGQSLTIVDPSREFEDIYNRMGQLMDLALGDFVMPREGSMAWSPLADVIENDDGYEINAELPGISKDQIDVHVQDRELIISGEMKNGQRGRMHRSTRRTGRFEYHTYLPGDIKPDKVNATLSNGVLSVRVPKSDMAKPRRIEVST